MHFVVDWLYLLDSTERDWGRKIHRLGSKMQHASNMAAWIRLQNSMGYFALFRLVWKFAAQKLKNSGVVPSRSENKTPDRLLKQPGTPTS